MENLNKLQQKIKSKPNKNNQIQIKTDNNKKQ